MTGREREFASIGFEYAEGIDRANLVIVPSTGREIRKTLRGTWEAQPWNDNYWKEFDDLLDAARFAMKPPKKVELCECGGEYHFNDYCGAEVCSECDNHKGLARCYCGWSASGGDGRRQLEEMGETIEPEDY